MKRLELSTFCMASKVGVRVSCRSRAHGYRIAGALRAAATPRQIPVISERFEVVMAREQDLCQFDCLPPSRSLIDLRGHRRCSDMVVCVEFKHLPVRGRDLPL
jgi:hypothetical protein